MHDAHSPYVDSPALRPRRPIGRWIAGVAIATAVVIGVAYWVVPRGGGRRSVDAKLAAEQAAAVLRNLQIYAAEHEDRFPPHLAAVVVRGLKPTMLVLRPGASPAAVPSGNAAWEAVAPDVDAHCDFVYTGAGVRGTDRPGIVVLCSKAGVLIGGRVVGFVDGRAEFVKDADLAGVFAADAAARDAAGRPRIAPAAW